MTSQRPTRSWDGPERKSGHGVSGDGGSPGDYSLPGDGAALAGSPDAVPRARYVRKAADGIVAALGLPARPASSEPIRRLPLTALHQLPHDTSMVYGIGRVDASGRVTSRDVTKAVGWRPGDKFEMTVTPGAIVLRACSHGIFAVPQRPCIVIPVTARRHHDIRPSDHVLLAAAPEYGIVIVHARSALDDMLAWYHSAHPATGTLRP